MKGKKSNRSITGKIIFAIVALLLVTALILSLFLSKYALICSLYSIASSKIKDGIRVVQISDIHNSEFGAENKRLLEAVKQQEPDLILITGDLINSDQENTDIAVSVIQKLCGIAPVYLSLGNHEVEYQINYGTNIISLFEEAGAVVLDRAYKDIEVHGQAVRIGGIYGYCMPERFLKTNEADPAECAWLASFQETDAYTILLCHMPYCWLKTNGLNEWNIDAVFAGHTHGGQVILPIIGGLNGPDLGWFPGYLQGLYYSEDGNHTLVLSRGLGTSGMIPRLNNIPEIVVVDILPK